MKEKKTSKEWYETIRDSGLIILDPDGWDRENYQYSFNEEKITKEEFLNRLIRSTTGGRIEYDPFHKLIEEIKREQ